MIDEPLTLEVEPEGMKGYPLRFQWGWSTGAQKTASVAFDVWDSDRGRWMGGVLTHEQVRQMAHFFSACAMKIEALPKSDV